MSDQKNNGPEGQNDQAQQDRPQTNSASSSITKLLEFLLSLPGAAQISEMVAKNFLHIGISGLVGLVGIGIGSKFLPSAPGFDQQKKTETNISSPTPSNPSYREEQIRMNEVCKKRKYYRLTLSTVDEQFFEAGEPTREDSGKEKVWPVYRLRCKYKVLAHKVGEKKVGERHEDAGVDLGKFCEDEYNAKFSAGYHHYDIPDSWHCVNSTP